MTISFEVAQCENDVRLALEIYISAENTESTPPQKQWSQQRIDKEFRHWLGIYHNTPEGFFIARDKDEIVGVAAVALRPPQWLLTNFFVDPRYHDQGIGKELLARALALRQGVERFCVHASTHANAQSLYLKAGLFPRPHSTWFRLDGEGLKGLLIRRPAELVARPVELSEVIAQINAWDRQTLGFEREVDHHWWSADGRYFILSDGQAEVGYFRLEQDGGIGPLIVAQPKYMADTLDLALLTVQETVSGSTCELLVPGDNQSALERLLRYGFQYQGVELLHSSVAMPHLSQVIFYDTDLL